MRRLQLTAAGHWYLALTIALGVVALVSGNNSLYLMESLLLSGLILSGILSERAISAVEVQFSRRPVSAGGANHDQIQVKNQRRFPLFGIEIGEWAQGRFEPLAYAARIGGRATVTLSSRQRFERRGAHRWEGFAVATSYPFGFARKLKIVRGTGERVVWPENLAARGPREADRAAGAGRHGGGEFSEGEVRAYTPDDDSRMIVWTLSARGEQPLVRMRRSDQETADVVLDLRAPAGPEFERRVAEAARPFYGHAGGERAESGSLVLLDWSGRRKFRGRAQALGRLALAEPAGIAPPAATAAAPARPGLRKVVA